MEYLEDDFLMLSGIQHFLFCPKQWGLIHIEQLWADSVDTIKGDLFHSKADSKTRERRGDILIVRSLQVHSRLLGLNGICDIVEFHRNNEGVKIFGETEKYLPFPIEYKKGRPKKNNADVVQLVAQAICLEEMLGINIMTGALFYGETRRRVDVEFTKSIRDEVLSLATEMHNYYKRGETPKAWYTTKCKKCSMYDQCLPLNKGYKSARKYIKKVVEADEI